MLSIIAYAGLSKKYEGNVRLNVIAKKNMALTINASMRVLCVARFTHPGNCLHWLLENFKIPVYSCKTFTENWVDKPKLFCFDIHNGLIFFRNKTFLFFNIES